MDTKRGVGLILLAVAVLFSGCGGGSTATIGTGSSSNGKISLFITDTPPAGVSVLSFQLTLSSATLSPGNVALTSTPLTFEATRLQTENALINSQNVAAGNYTGVALTFANPVMTFRNDGASAVTVGSTSCAVGAICTAAVPTLAHTSVTLNLPLTVTTNTTGAVLVDLNLDSFLVNSSGTVTADAQASGAVSASVLAPVSGSFAAMEDVTGVVGSVNSSAGTFQLQTAVGTYSISTNSGTSGTVFLNFPVSGTCSANFGCLANGQVASVDMDLLTGGSLLATDVFFEDASSSQAEIEGMIVATTGLTAPAQFEMVVLQESPSSSGPAIGSLVPVVPGTAETFDVDALGTGSATNTFSFAGVQDLVVGQTVQVQSASGSTNSQLTAARVRLRSTRLTAQIQSIGLPNIFLNALPPIFGSAGITQVQGLAIFPPAVGAYTEIAGTATNSSQISVGSTVSVRGQLFKNNTSFPMVMTKVVKH